MKLSLKLPKMSLGISLLKQHPLRSEIELLVNEILESMKQGKDTTALEDKIDRMVYGLTEEEIVIVEGKG